MERLTQGELNAVNEAFNKLLRNLGIREGVLRNIFVPHTRSNTVAPIQLFVDANTGHDANPGSKLYPVKTMARAISLIPKEIYHPVVVNVGAGTYDGFNLNDFVIGDPADESLGSYIDIVGAWQDYTPSQGLASGAITSLNAFGSQGESGYITITGANWVPDELKNKFFKVVSGTGSGQWTYTPIVSNTSDTIYFRVISGTQPIAGSVINFQELATTILDVPASDIKTLSGTNTNADGKGTQSKALIRISNNSGGYDYSIRIRNFKITLNSSSSISRLRVQFNRLKTLLLNTHIGGSSTTATASVAIQGSPLTIGSSIIEKAAAGTLVFCQSSQSTEQLPLTLDSSIIDGVNSASNGTGIWPSGSCIISACLVKNLGKGIYANYLFTSQIVGLKLDTCVSGIYADFGSNYATGPQPISLGLNGCSADNCTTAFLLSGLNTGMNIKFSKGSGNTTAFSIKQGASVAIRSDVSTTGSTEIALDGSNTTLATMRAASPKLVRDPNYLSVAFEGTYP